MFFNIFRRKAQKPPHTFDLVVGMYQRTPNGAFASGHCLVTKFDPGNQIITFSGTYDLEMEINVSNQSLSNMRATLLQMKSGMNFALEEIIPAITRDWIDDKDRIKIERLRVFCSQSPLVHQLRGEWKIHDEVIDGYVSDVHQLAKKFKHGVEFVFLPSSLNPVQDRCKWNFENFFEKKKEEPIDLGQICQNCEKEISYHDEYCPHCKKNPNKKS